VGVACGERRAVRHLGDGVGFDDLVAAAVAPDLARIAVDRFGQRRFVVEAVHVRPLLHDLVGIFPLHQRVGAAVPDRELTFPIASPRFRLRRSDRDLGPICSFYACRSTSSLLMSAIALAG
jgi:hypothetical protein